MEFIGNMDILQVVRNRKSVRSYNGSTLTSDQVSVMNKAIADAKSPFGGKVAIRLKDYGTAGDFTPSTYGVITGARSYLLMAIGDDLQSNLSGGFMMEHVVLRATEIGLGTCWIAATFRGTDFEKDTQWEDGMKLRIVSPIGLAANRKSFKDRIMRLAVSSDKRKPFGELFYHETFSKSLDEDGLFGKSLAMMRLAPSSTNSQPWRAVVSGNDVHFYYKTKSSLAVIDCGIGLCHFSLTENALSHHGNFYHSDNPPQPLSGLGYLISYTRMR